MAGHPRPPIVAASSSQRHGKSWLLVLPTSRLHPLSVTEGRAQPSSSYCGLVLPSSREVLTGHPRPPRSSNSPWNPSTSEGVRYAKFTQPRRKCWLAMVCYLFFVFCSNSFCSLFLSFSMTFIPPDCIGTIESSLWLDSLWYRSLLTARAVLTLPPDSLDALAD